MLLVDTSVLIEYFRSPRSLSAQRLDSLLDTTEIVLGDLVLVELLQGLREGRELRLVEAGLASFGITQLCSQELAPKAAANYRSLRRKGLTICGTIDVIIATWCIENRVPLLHNDRDFDVMEAHLGLPCWR